MRHLHLASSSLLLALTGSACLGDGNDLPTASDAREALEQSAVSSQVDLLVGDGVELSTQITIGTLVQWAAAEIGFFVQTQLPCAEVSVVDDEVSIEYGAQSGECEWHGQTLSGEHTIRVVRNEVVAGVRLEHTFRDFDNGRVSVTGTAAVTWTPSAPRRRVVHDLRWTVLTGPRQGATFAGMGDRTQTALDGGFAEGIRIDGTRSFTSDRGRFDLDIDGVELRWEDPVPQAGSYVLVDPEDNVLTLEFERIDSNTIFVSISNELRSFGFEVDERGLTRRSDRGEGAFSAHGR